jgi:hypothetical protein
LFLELTDNLAQGIKVGFTDSEALWLGWHFFEKFVWLYETFEA